MSLGAALYPLLKPLLFRLDAERAHEWTTTMMRFSHRFGMLGRETPPDQKPASVLGLRFPNRVGLAAGMDKSAQAVEAWAGIGFGFVEVGTLTPRPQPGNPKPRLFRLPSQHALINRMGFNNPGIAVAVERLKRRRTSAVIGVNIGKNYDTPNDRAVDDYLHCLRACYEVADYVAVNISSPNTQGLRDLQAEEPVRRLLATLLEERDRLALLHGIVLPLLVKIAPDLDEAQIDALAGVFNELRIDGVIATNTTIDKSSLAGHALAGEQGGLSGAPVKEISDRVLTSFRDRLSPEIVLVGVGGILSGEDALHKRSAGAELVQVYSGLVFRGPRLLRDCAKVLIEKE